MAKLTVEEYYNESINDVSQRGVNLRTIKIEPTGGQLGNKSSSSRPNIGSIYNIIDLFSLVKQYDDNFHPKPVHESMIENGKPKVFYHGMNAEFTEFDRKKARYGYIIMKIYKES